MDGTPLIELRAGLTVANISRLGAEWRSWSVDGRALLWAPDGLHWDRVAPLLFPVCGWTREGTVRVGGRAYPLGLHALAQHRTQGHRLVIISATADFIVRRVAACLGVSDVMAIELAQQDGRYTGQTQGVLTFREGKVLRLQAWLERHQMSLEGSFGYSDSLNDVPLLNAVAHASVVNASGELLELARLNQWQTLRWAITDSML